MNTNTSPSNNRLDIDPETGLSRRTMDLVERKNQPIDPDEELKTAQRLLQATEGLMTGNEITCGEYRVQAFPNNKDSYLPPYIQIKSGNDVDRITFNSWKEVEEFTNKFNKKTPTQFATLINQGLQATTSRDGGNREMNRGSLKEAFIYATNA